MTPLPESALDIRSIAQVARMLGVKCHVRTLRRRLLAMHARDRLDGGRADWLVRPGKRKLHVNLARFRRAHPEWFGVRQLDEDAIDALVDKVTAQDARIFDSERRIKVHSAVLKRLATERKVG